MAETARSLGADCPTCGTLVPTGRVRCPGCGRVFGEDNRCPHCHAIAAVRPAGDGYVCTACSKPRERKPLTTVLGEEQRSSIVPDPPRSARGRGLRLFGTLSVGAGVLGAALTTALLGLGALGITASALIGLTGIVLGFSALRRASSVDERVRISQEKTAEARIREAAKRLGGDVTAKAIAEALEVPVEDADRALTRMADGTSITVEVDTDEGTLHFVFHDIVAQQKERVKVRVPEVDTAAPSAAKEEPEAGTESEGETDAPVRKSRI